MDSKSETAGAPTRNDQTNGKPQGLSAADVAERIASGRTNAVKEHTSRSYADIFRANIFTRFNALLGFLFVIIILFGDPTDALFGMVLVVNTLVGIVQEVRAKWALDRLSLLSAPRARVVREGVESEVATGDVVLDDLISVKTGDQVVADGAVLASHGLEVDESLLTGESAAVGKVKGDQVMSGSFIVSGAGMFEATRVGEDAYARKLARQAKQFTLVRSDLRDGISKILKYISWIMVPAGLLLLLSQLYRAQASWHDAVTGTVAGLVGMVPEGLVLLTSIAFAVSAIALTRRKVLVQELPAVEGLARIDVICLDKTGTITEGKLKLKDLDKIEAGAPFEEVLSGFASDALTSSSTLAAIAGTYPASKDIEITGSVPFSSIRKWSAESFEGKGSWILGAPEVLLEKVPAAAGLREKVDRLASSGLRVLLLTRSPSGLDGDTLPEGLEPVALLTFEEKIRQEAPATLEYFRDQGVKVKVISGDNPVTVGAVATRAGLDAGTPLDARKLPDGGEEFADAVEKTTVFGRVTPEQKKSMVEALQSRGHVVAMTGDGVNDVLALKQADIGIAMGSGSPATRAVAELVLLDGNFAAMPGVVAEGRRVAGNIERVANLFLTKTVYATMLTIVIGLAGWRFLFLPRHLTIVSALTIGGPALVLSFAPNKRRYMPGFVARVLRFTIPAGLVAAGAVMAAGALAHIYHYVTLAQSRTMATIVLATIGFWVLAVLSEPFNWWKATLVLVMIGTFAMIMVLTAFWPWFGELVGFSIPAPQVLVQTAAIAGAALFLLEFAWKFTGWQPHQLKGEEV